MGLREDLPPAAINFDSQHALYVFEGLVPFIDEELPIIREDDVMGDFDADSFAYL